MSEPQHAIRAYLEDGPHAGETLSVPPDDGGAPPGRITVAAAGGADPAGVSEPTADDDAGPSDTTALSGPADRSEGGGPGTSGNPGPSTGVTYRFADRDLDNGVYRYRVAP